MVHKSICLLMLCFLFQGFEVRGLDINDSFNRPLRSVGLDFDNRPVMSRSFFSSYTQINSNSNTLINIRDLNRNLCQYYITQYSNPSGLAWLKASMERAAPYLGFIQREIRQMNLPEELIYLPVIESGYVATATSSSGAAGLWQFMRNSIDPFDMKVTDWMDERRDFWKSTQGALRKLEENYRAFGDWPLALAAYNAGTGAINNIIRQTGIRDYWTLCERNLLKTETIHYVPKLLAAAYILSNAREYGIVLWPEDPLWTRIQVNRSVDLNLLAAEAGIDPAILRMANPELNYQVTPPDNYFLKVRAEDAPKVSAALASSLPLINYYLHTIRSGDTLSALASHYGVTVDQINAMNPGVQARYLRIGSTLMIPAIREAPRMPTASGENVSFTGSYVVKKGESLWSIALAHGVSPEALAQANNMGLNDILREGRVLKTPIR